MISVVVGTAHDCDVRLPGPYLSPHHFRIYGYPNMAYVEDLGSTNGTMVKPQLLFPWQKVISPVAIVPGAMVVGGRVLIEVHLDGRVTCRPNLSNADMEDLFLTPFD